MLHASSLSRRRVLVISHIIVINAAILEKRRVVRLVVKNAVGTVVVFGLVRVEFQEEDEFVVGIIGIIC